MSDFDNKKVINKRKLKNINISQKGTITLDEGMIILKDKSNLSKEGLRTAARRDGFKSEFVGAGRNRFLLDYKNFLKWIKNNIANVPVGFCVVSHAAKELNITSAYAYVFIKKYSIKTIITGSGKGKIHVDFKTFKKVFEANYKYKRKR